MVFKQCDWIFKNKKWPNFPLVAKENNPKRFSIFEPLLQKKLLPRTLIKLSNLVKLHKINWFKRLLWRQTRLFFKKMSDRFDIVLIPINVEIKNKAKQKFLTFQIDISLSLVCKDNFSYVKTWYWNLLYSKIRALSLVQTSYMTSNIQ